MKKVFYLFIVVCFLVTLSCKKDSNPTPTPPVISFGSFTASDPYTARLTFNFTDIDGDIGYQDYQQDSTNYDFYMRFYYKNYLGNYVPFHYHDPTQGHTDTLRDNTIYVYHIPYVTNNIKSKKLDGQIIIDLNGYKPFAGVDSLSNLKYTFWIYDRARHKSNVDTTPAYITPTH